MATAVSFDDARRVADAVLFEGTSSTRTGHRATENQLRWQFGIVAPPGADTGDASMQQAEVLADGLTDDARIDLCVRFLHLETRRDVVPWDEDARGAHVLVHARRAPHRRRRHDVRPRAAGRTHCR